MVDLTSVQDSLFVIQFRPSADHSAYARAPGPTAREAPGLRPGGPGPAVRETPGLRPGDPGLRPGTPESKVRKKS